MVGDDLTTGEERREEVPVTSRDQANTQAFERLTSADPVLVDVVPAGAVIPELNERAILTSGPPLPWSEYVGGQRAAIIGAALYEGFATDEEEADRLLSSGEVRVHGCQDYGAVGSLAGIYTASMPVFVVENQKYGNVAYCNLFEGRVRKRLNYGVYDKDVEQRLRYIERVAAPVLRAAVRRSEGIPLKALIARALHMGDELHSRNAAATLLFTRELFPHLFALHADATLGHLVPEVLGYIGEGDYFFLRLSMAAAKATADAAHGIDHASVVSAMTFSCKEFGIRVSGLGSEWFRAPLPAPSVRLFEGFSVDDVEAMGGESTLNETVGLGGYAQAAAFPLQRYQGGDPEEMCRNNLELYSTTVGEHPDFQIPFFRYRGTPTGIDVFRVLSSGVVPIMDIGIAGRAGGQIGAGTLRAPVACFGRARDAYEQRCGPVPPGGEPS